MSLDDLIKYIEEEVAKELESARVQTDKKLIEIEEHYQSEKNKLRAEYEKKLSEEKNNQMNQAMTQARIQKNATILSVKRRILDDFYNKLWNRIESLDIETKKTLYTKLLSKIDTKPNSKLIISTLDTNLWEKIKPTLKHIKIEESDNFKGGFIYKTENITVDYTFENIFNNYRQATEIEIAQKLLPKL